MAADQVHSDELDPDLPDMQAAAAGDAAACRRLVDRHLRRLHAYAARMLDDPSEAEDACQEAFLGLWQQAPRWEPGRAKIATWLYRVVINGCRDRLRQRRPIEPVERIDAEAAGDAEHPASRHEQDERRRHLHALVDGLPERQREALLLFHLEGHSQAETAAILQISVDALESLLARARRSLRAQVGTDGETG